MGAVDRMKKATAVVQIANREIYDAMASITSADRLVLLSEDAVRGELRKALKELDDTLRALRKMA